MRLCEKYDYIEKRINLSEESAAIDMLTAILEYSEKHNNSKYNNTLYELLNLAFFENDLTQDEIDELCQEE